MSEARCPPFRSTRARERLRPLSLLSGCRAERKRPEPGEPRRRAIVRWRSERGAAAVEFAVILPLLVVFLFAIIAFGIALSRTHAYFSAARRQRDMRRALPAGGDGVHERPHRDARDTDGEQEPHRSRLADSGPGLLGGGGQLVTVSWSQSIPVEVPLLPDLSFMTNVSGRSDARTRRLSDESGATAVILAILLLLLVGLVALTIDGGLLWTDIGASHRERRRGARGRLLVRQRRGARQRQPEGRRGRRCQRERRDPVHGERIPGGLREGGRRGDRPLRRHARPPLRPGGRCHVSEAGGRHGDRAVGWCERCHQRCPLMLSHEPPQHLRIPNDRRRIGVSGALLVGQRYSNDTTP
jgi:Flp pilus assembly pilin Flp